jgi:hypothetical protein
MIIGSDRFANFNKARGIPLLVQMGIDLVR